MLGNFTYHNPTKIYFGKGAVANLKTELAKYGKNVLLVYGGGSIKKNGVYDEVVKILQESGKEIYEDAGVMPNPTLHKLQEGCERARNANADLILAVGGGSVCDYAKGVAACAHCETDFWEKYYVKKEKVDNKIIPVGCVLTMVGTGSEMNATSVITNTDKKFKGGRTFDERIFPKFSVLDPTYTFTLPRYQMLAGIYDIMSHILEQYFSGEDDNTSDYLAEGLLRSLIHSAKIAAVKPTDYEARSNIMWTATWALNTLLDRGKTTDWEVHMLGHAVSAHTDATHGMTLAAVSLAYYRHILPFAVAKFKRYAIHVWDVDPAGKTDMQIAEAGLLEMEKWMRSLDLVMELSTLGVQENMLEALADSVVIKQGGYKILSRADVIEILKASL